MKDKFKEKYILMYYRNCLLGKLHVWDYMARFDGLNLRCDVRMDATVSYLGFI